MHVTLVYVAWSVPLVLVTSLALAVMLNRGVRGLAIYRTVFYIPSLIGSSVAIAFLWRQFFGLHGVFNDVLGYFGFATKSWIANPNSALATLIALDVWTFGASMVIFLAALRQVPQEFYEAARIDGSSAIQRFRFITLPLLTPVMFFAIVHADAAFVPGLHAGAGDLAGHRRPDRLRRFCTRSISTSAASSACRWAMPPRWRGSWCSPSQGAPPSTSGRPNSGFSTMAEQAVMAPALPMAHARTRADAALQGRQFLIHCMLIRAALVTLYPVIWFLVSSFKPQSEIFSSPLFTSDMTLENYVSGWNFFGDFTFRTFFVNSFLICGLAVIGNIFSCSLAAYAFARLHFPLKKIWFALVLGSIMLPIHADLIPQYIVFYKLGWVNTILPLVIPKFLASDALYVFLMVQFMKTLPQSWSRRPKSTAPLTGSATGW